MKDDREARDILDDLVKDIEAELRVCARLELESAVGRADRDREGIHACALHEFLHLFRTGVSRIFSGDVDVILDAGQSAELSLDDSALSVRVLDDLLRDLDVLLERLAGSVDHDGCEAVVHAGLAGLEIRAVIQMHDDVDVRAAKNSRFDKLLQIDRIRILAGAGGSLKNHR